MDDFWRMLRERQRKIISLIIAVTFVFSMTGIDVILVHAFDQNHHENYNQMDDLYAPANPLADSNPDAFIDISTDEKSSDPIISDTKLNVLKAEYGDLLNTVSLQTVAERSTSGVNLESAVINALQDQGQLTGTEQPVDSGTEMMPEIDPTLIAEAATTGQGPLSFTLELGSLDIGVRQDEGGTGIVKLPVPVVAVQEEEPQPETTDTSTQVAETEEDTAGATIATNETQPQADVAILQSEDQTDQNQTVPVDTEQAETQEIVDLPDIQDSEQPAETTETEQAEESEGTLMDLANEFLSRLGFGTEDQKDDVLNVEEVAVENEAETAGTQETQEEGNETVDPETENTEDIIVMTDTEGEEGEGEATPGTEDEEEGEVVVPGEESPEEIAAKNDEDEGEGTEEEASLPDLIAALLLGEDEGETEGEVDTELLEAIMDEFPEELPEIDTGEGMEGEVDISALLDEMGIELDNEGMPAEAEELSSVLVEEDAPDAEQGEEVIEEDTGLEDAPVTNTDSEHAEEDETSLVGPETTMKEEKLVEEEEEEPEEGDPSPEDVAEAATVAKDDVLEKDLSDFTKEASAINVLKSMNLDLPSGVEAGYLKKLGGSFKDGLNLITGKDKLDTQFLKGINESGVDPKNLEVPEEIGMTVQALPEQIDVNMKLVMGQVKDDIKKGKDEIGRLKLMSVMAVAGLLEEGSSIPDAPNVDTDPVYQDWTGSHSVSGSDPWTISEMYSHPEPPEEEQPDPECSDYLSFGIVLLIFGIFVEFENFLENPSWESFGEFLWAMFDPVGHMIYELVNFDWDELAAYGEFAQSPIGKLIMFIITIILTIVTFGSAAPILIALIILIELIQMFVPLPKWLDIALSIVKAALGGWASAIKGVIKQALKVTMAIIMELLSTLTPAVIKSIIKSIIKEILMQIMAEVLPDDLMILRTVLGLAADVLASGLAELLTGGSLEDIGAAMLESLKNMFGLNSTADMSTLLKVITSSAVRAIVVVCIQVAIIENHDNAGQGMMAGAIWGAVASGTLGYIGQSFGTTRPTDAMDEFMMALTQIAAPVVAASLSTFMQLYGSQDNEDAGFARNQTMLMGDILSSFGTLMVGSYSPGINGGYSNLVTTVMEMVAPVSAGSVRTGDISNAIEIKEGDGEGDGDGDKSGKGVKGTKGVNAGSNLVGTSNVISDFDGLAPNGLALAVNNASLSQPMEAELDLGDSEVETEDAQDNSTSSSVSSDRRSNKSSQSSSHHGMNSQTKKNQPQQQEIKKETPKTSSSIKPQTSEQPQQVQQDTQEQAQTLYTSSTDITSEENLLTSSADGVDRQDAPIDRNNSDHKQQQEQQQIEVKDLNKKMAGKTIAEQLLEKNNSVIKEEGRLDEEGNNIAANIKTSGTGGGGDGDGGGGGGGDGAGTGGKGLTGTGGSGTNVTATTNMAAMNLSQQLQQSGNTGNLPANYQAKSGSTTNSSTMSSGMAKNQDHLQTAMQALKAADALPGGNPSLKVDTYINEAGNNMMAISQVNADGSTSLLSVSESLGDQTLTTVFKPNGSGGSTASTFAGDANNAKQIGPEVDVSRNLTEGFNPAGEKGFNSTGPGGSQSRGGSHEGDQIELVDDLDPVTGSQSNGAKYDESGKLIKPGQGEEIALGSAGESTLAGKGGTADSSAVAGSLANGEQVKLTVDGAGNVQVNGTSEALQDLMAGKSETVTLPNGETATLNYDAGTGKVSVNGSSTALQSLQDGAGGSGSIGGTRSMDVKLPGNRDATVSIDAAGNVSMTGNPEELNSLKADGGGSLDVTLPNGKSATIDVDGSGKMTMSGSMDALGSAMDKARNTAAPLADMSGKEVTLKLKDGRSVTGTVSPDGTQLLMNEDQAAKLNPGGNDGQKTNLGNDPGKTPQTRDMQITMPDGSKIDATVSENGRQINLNQSGDQNGRGGGGGSGEAKLSDQTKSSDNPLNPSADSQNIVNDQNQKSEYTTGRTKQPEADNLAEGQKIIPKKANWAQRIVGKIFGVDVNGFTAIQQTFTVELDGKVLDITFEPQFLINATDAKTFMAIDQFGNDFMVSVKPNGEVFSITRSIKIGSWHHFVIAYETVYSSNPASIGQAVTYDENGQIYSVFTRDPQTSEWKMTFKRDYTNDASGMQVSALLDIKDLQLPPGARKALILSNPNVIAQNPYFNQMMEDMGIDIRSEEYGDRVKARAMVLAAEGVRAAQVYLQAVKTELGQNETVVNIMEQEAFKTAIAVLAQTQVTQYWLDNSKVTINTIATNALRGNDPAVMLMAANLKVSTAENVQADILVTTAMNLIENSKTMPVSVKLELSIQAMEILSDAGRSNNRAFNSVAQYAAGLIKTRGSSSAVNFAQAVRLLNVSDQTVIDRAIITDLQILVTNTVNEYAANLAPTKSVNIANVGILTRSVDGRLFLTQEANGFGVTISFTRDDSQSNSWEQIESISISDQQGERITFKMQDGSLSLFQHRVTMSMEINGQDTTRNIMVKAHMVVENGTKATAFFKEDGKDYLLEINLQTNTAIATLQFDRSCHDFIQQGLPDALVSQNNVSFIIENGKAFFIINGRREAANQIPEVNAKHLTALGIPENLASAIVSNLTGKPAYIASDGTLMIGSQAEILAGKYYVAGRNQFTGSTETLGYFGQYENGIINRVDLSDKRIISYLNGGTQYYTVTQYSPDKKRVMVSLYNNGRLTGSKLILRDFKNLELIYDVEGNITPESLRSLRTHGIDGISVKFDPGQGFTIRNEQTKQEIKFSMSGRHMLETNGFDDPKGKTTPKGLQESAEFDVKRSMSFNVAGYHNQGVRVTVHTHESYSVTVSVNNAGKLTRVLTRTDFFHARDQFVQHTEGYVFNPQTSQFAWILQQVRASQAYLQENNYWPQQAFDANRAETNSLNHLQADQYNLFAVGINQDKLTLMGKTGNGAMGFCSVEVKPNHLGEQVMHYSFGATGTPEQLRELGLKVDDLRKQNQADLGERLILDENKRYTVVKSNGSHTLQGQTANGTMAFVTVDRNGRFTFGGTGTVEQLDELQLRASDLLKVNGEDERGDISREIKGTHDGQYTVVESENGSHILQGKLGDKEGTTAFATIDKNGKYSFGATADLEKLDDLGFRANEISKMNIADELGEASREVLSTDSEYTMVETEAGINTLQGKTRNGADAFATLDADDNYSFGATAEDLATLDALGLKATEIADLAVKDKGNPGQKKDRDIGAKDGRFTAIDSFKEQGKHAYTLQGRAGNGADVWATLDSKNKYSYGGNGDLKQLDDLGLDATKILNKTIADNNGEIPRTIQADDGKYTVVQNRNAFTLQGLAFNDAKAFATLKNGKYTYGATGSTTQLDDLGLKGTDITTQNQADAAGKKSRTILADHNGDYTIVQDGSSRTLQGKTANGANAFVTLARGNKYSFGATSSDLKVLDELGLNASYLAGRAYNDTGNGETVRRSIGRRDGVYTAIDSGGVYTLQGVAANGASAFATLSDGKFSFGASGTKEQLDALGLECSDLLEKNAADKAGTVSRGIHGDSDTGYYTVVQNGDVKTLQGVLGDKTTKAFFSKNTVEGKYSFGATANREKLDALGLKGSDLLDHNAADQAGEASRLISADENGLYTVVDSYTGFTLQGKLLGDGKTQAFTSRDLDGNFSFGATSTSIDKLVGLGLRSEDILKLTAADNRGAGVDRTLQGNEKNEFTGVDANGSFTLQGKTLNEADGFATLDAQGNYSFGASGTLTQLNALGLRGSWMLNNNTAGSWDHSRKIQGRGENKDVFTVVQGANTRTIQGKLLNGADGFLTYNAETKEFTFGATGTQAQLQALGLRGNYLITTNRADKGNDGCTDSRRIKSRTGENNIKRYTIVQNGSNRTLQGKLNDGTVAFASVDRAGNYSFGATANEAKLNRLGLRGSTLLIRNAAESQHPDSRTILPVESDKYTVVETKGTDTLQGLLNDKKTSAFLSVTKGEDGTRVYNFGATSEDLVKLDNLGLDATKIRDASAKGHGGKRTIFGKDGKFTAIESSAGAYTLQGITANGATAFATIAADGKFTFGATGNVKQLKELGLPVEDLLLKNEADAAAFLKDGDYDKADGLNHDRTIQKDMDGKYTVVESDGSFTMQGKLAKGTPAFATLDKEGKFSFGATAAPDKLKALGMPCDDLIENSVNDKSGNFYMGTHKVEKRRIKADAEGRYTVIVNEESDMTLQGKTANGAQAFVSLSDGEYTYGATGTDKQLDGLNLKGSYLIEKNGLLPADKRIVSADGRYTIVQSDKNFTLQGKNAAGENVSLSRDEGGGYSYSETKVRTDNEGNEVSVGVSTQLDVNGHLSGETNVSVGIGEDAASVSMGKGLTISINTDNEVVLQDARGVKEVYSQSGERETGRWQRVKNAGNKFTNYVSQSWKAFGNRFDAIWNTCSWNGESNSVWSVIKWIGGAFATVGVALWSAIATIAYTLELILTVIWEVVEIAVVASLDYNPLTAGLSWVVGELTGKTMGEWLLAGIKEVVEILFIPIDFIFKYVGMAIAWIGEQFSLMSEALFHFAGQTNSFFLQAIASYYGALAFVVGFAGQFIGENLAIIIIVALSIIVPAFAVFGMILLAKDAILHGAGNMFRTFFIEPFTKLAHGFSMFAHMNQLDNDISTVRVVTQALLVIGGALVGLVFAFLMIKGMLAKAKGLYEKMYTKKTVSKIQSSALSPRQLAKKTIGDLVGEKAAKGLSPEVANMTFGKLRFSNHKGTINSMLAKRGGATKVSNLLKSKQFRLSELSMNGKPLTSVLTAKALGFNGFQRGMMAVGSMLGAFFIHQVDIFRHAGKAMFNLAKGRVHYTTKAGVAKTADIRSTGLFKSVSKGAVKMMNGARSLVKGGRTTAQPSSKVATVEKGLTSERSGSTENVNVSEAKPGSTTRGNNTTVRNQTGPGQGTTRQQAQTVKTMQSKLTTAQANLQKALAGGKATARQIAGLKGQVTKAQNALAKSMGMTTSQMKMQLAQENFAKATSQQGRAVAKAEISRLNAEGRVESAKGRQAAKQTEIAKLKKQIKDLGKNPEAMEKRQSLERKLDAAKAEQRTAKMDIQKAEVEMEAANLQGEMAKTQQKLESKSLNSNARSGLQAKVAELKAKLNQNSLKQKAAGTQKQIADLEAKLDRMTGDAEVRKALAEKGGLEREMATAEKQFAKEQEAVDKAQASQNQSMVKDLLNQAQKTKKSGMENAKAGTLEKALDKVIKELGSKINKTALKQMIADVLLADPSTRRTARQMRELFKGESGKQLLRDMANNGMKNQAQKLFDQLLKETGQTLTEGMKNALREQLGLRNGIKASSKLNRGIMEKALEDVFSMKRGTGRNQLLNEGHARAEYNANQRMINEVQQLQGKSSAEVQRGLERVLNERFGKAHKEMGTSKFVRKSTIHEVAKNLSAKQLQKLLASDSPIEMLRELKKGPGKSLTEMNAKAKVLTAAEKPLVESLVKSEAGTPGLNTAGAVKRMQQLATAKWQHQQAVAKLNQATTAKARTSALKAVDKAASNLENVKSMADARSEAGGYMSELGLKISKQGGLKGKAYQMLPETIKVRQGLKAAAAEAELGTGLQIEKIMKAKEAVEKAVQERKSMNVDKAKAAVNELMTLRENMIKLEQVSEKAAQAHRRSQSQSKGPNSSQVRKAAQARTEAQKNYDIMKKAFDAKMAELKLTKADLQNLSKYDQALSAADVTSAIEKSWNDTYKTLIEKARQSGKLQEYENSIKRFDAEINKVLDQVSASEVKVKGGTAFHEAFMKFRENYLKTNGIEMGSAKDVQMIQSYSQRVMAKITGYPGLRVAQQIMLTEFLRGNNIGLRAGGGKTLPFIMFPGQIRMLMGKVLRAELLVDDPAAIDKYIGESFGNKVGGRSMVHQDLAKAMGIELVSGNNMYKQAQKTGNYSELIKTLNDPTKTVIFDHTTRAHLRNAAMRNAGLHNALKSTNLIGIDEVHMPATSQTSAIVGGKIKAPTEAMMKNVNDLLDAFKFESKSFEKVFENYQQKYINNKTAFAGKKIMLGEFEVVHEGHLTNAKAAQYNLRGRKTIVITETEVFLNTKAQQALKKFKGADVSSAIKTLFSQQGKAGELNAYAVENGYIYPVDNLGKIQYEQISNDITGQIVAARKAGLRHPSRAVRVNTTSMQTSLSAMYAGNNGARIVGASGTIAGLENLMQSKIGSNSVHLSTSRFNVQGDILNTGGKILTDLAAADRIVIDSLTRQRRSALVFETDPAMQLKLVETYMAKMMKNIDSTQVHKVDGQLVSKVNGAPVIKVNGKLMVAKVNNIPSISVISASGTGYYVPEGTAAQLIKQLNLRDVKIHTAKKNASPVKGLDYIQVKKAGIQTIVEGVGNKAMQGNHICIINEQAAVGKNFQADLTLVARNTTGLTADMFTQLLLRSGRPGGKGPNGTWATTRYAVIDPVKLQANLELIKTRNAELGEIWKSDSQMANQMTQLLKGLSKTDLSKMDFNNQQTLSNALKLNGEFRQAELVGNATRFSVQDTFKDKLVIEPLKKAIQSDSFAQQTTIQRILENQMSKVLNERASKVDVSLKIQSGLQPHEINNQYARSTFLASVQQARGVWGFKGVLGQALIPTNFFRGGYKLVGMSLWTYGRLMFQAPKVVKAAPLENAKSFADIQVGEFQKLYSVGHNLMQGVLSLNSGGMQAAKLQNATVAINRAVNQNRTPSAAETRDFRKAWGESNNAIRNIINKHGYTTEAVNMAAEQLGVTANVARIAMAENFHQATQMLQHQMRNNRHVTGIPLTYEGPAVAPDALPELSKPIQLAGMNRFGKWIKGLPMVSPMLNNFDARMASTAAAAVQIREAEANFNSPTWQAQNQTQVDSFKQRFGDKWVAGAMTETYGPDMSYLKSYNSSKTGIQRTFAALRQPAQGQKAYTQTLHNIQTVSQRLPELQTDLHKTITYQGQTMSLSQAKLYLNNQVAAASSLATRYGLNQGKALNFLNNNNHWSKQADAVETRANVMARAAATGLDQQNWFSRGMDYVGQKWQGMLETLVRTSVIAPLFKTENGKIIPATTTKLMTGAVALSVLSLAGVGVPLLGTALLGMASGTLLKPLMARITPHMAMKNAATTKKARGILTRFAIPAVMLAAGIFFQIPMMVGASVGSLNSEVVEHVMSSKNEAEITVNDRGGYLREKQQKEAATDKADETMAKEAKQDLSVVEEWKQAMGEEKDGKKSAETLKDILKKRNVQMVTGSVAQHYGYMHMLAALVSLVPQSLSNISRMEIGEKLDQKELEQIDKAKQSVVVDQGSIKFLDQSFSEIILTQLLQAVTDKLFTDATSFTLKETLRQHRLFKEYGENSLVEFMKQYITDGQSLWALCSGEKSLRKVYEQVAETIGREYAQSDLAELTTAAGELENEAVSLMKKRAQEIKQADEQDRPLQEIEFEAMFGVSWENYNKMINPPFAQRILTRLVSKERLKGTDSVVAVRSVGQQLVGVGLTLVAIGTALLIITGILPVMAGVAAAIVGIGLAIQGMFSWIQAERIAFNLNPSNAVNEQLSKATFASANSSMLGDAKVIANKTGAAEFKLQKIFEAQYDMTYETFSRVSIHALLEDQYFKKSVEKLRVAGTEQMISETMRNRAIRVSLQHLLGVVESDISREMKLDITRDITQILGFLQFDINMTFKKYADELSVTLTPEVVPRTLTQDHKLGRIIKRLEGLGVGIKLDIQPIRKQPKLKTTGAAA